MNIFKKALIVALSVGLISVPTVTKEVEAANMSGGEVLYLAPNSNWTQSNARFAAYFFGSGDTWASMTKSGSYYKVTVPAGSWTNVIFCRMNPSSTTNDWNNKWNQSGDLVWDGDKNLCKINSNHWDCGTNVTWSTYYEYKLTLNYNNEGATTDKVIDLKAGKQTTDLGTTPTWDGHIFKGWSTAKDTTVEYAVGVAYNANVTGNVTLYAVWEEVTKPVYPVTVNVGSFTDVINVEEGTSIDKVASDMSIKLNNHNLVVKEWDFTGNITGATTINATKYYTTIDEVKSELGFSYNFTSTKVVLKVVCDYGVPVCTGIVKDNPSDTYEQKMTWIKKDETDSKKKTEFVVEIPMKYNQLKFAWENPDNPDQKGTFTVDRDYYNNAVWCDDTTGTSKGNYHYADYSDLKINSVSDMNLRIGTLALPIDGFGGVSEYGIRIAKASTIANDNFYGPKWTQETVAKVDVKGNEKVDGEYIRWNAVVNNIPEEYFAGDFTASAYVVIDGVEYDICTNGPRTVSVVDLADEYTKKLDGLNKYACQFNIENYKA